MAETTMATMAETTMAEMVCGRNVQWPNRSVDETSRKLLFEPILTTTVP